MLVYQKIYEGNSGKILVTVKMLNHRSGSRNPEGEIRYHGAGNITDTHGGYLTFVISPDENYLRIKIVNADPNGASLGSLLIFEAMLQAARFGVSRVEAISVAADARGFYLKSGFHPSRATRAC